MGDPKESVLLGGRQMSKRQVRNIRMTVFTYYISRLSRIAFYELHLFEECKMRQKSEGSTLAYILFNCAPMVLV